MDRWAMRALAACTAVAVTAGAQATTISYSSFSLLNAQNVTLNDSALGVVNESGLAGQITLAGTNTPGGSIASWCIDILHSLASQGQFTTGNSLSAPFANQFNALVTHVQPTLSITSSASAALQVAIWEMEYGSGLNVTAPSDVIQLASSYVTAVTNGTWLANPSLQVTVLNGNGTNQNQAELTAVPEPASLLLLGGGLVVLGVLRYRWLGT